MKYSFKAWFYGRFFHSLCKPQYKAAGVTSRKVGKIVKEHKTITIRAKEMNDEKLLSSYIMGIYFIAMSVESAKYVRMKAALNLQNICVS